MDTHVMLTKGLVMRERKEASEQTADVICSGLYATSRARFTHLTPSYLPTSFHASA